jgi:hypothetical protein
MKKLILFLLALSGVIYSYSQEMVLDGNMAKASSWQTASPMGGADAATFEFNFSDDAPTLGEDGCLAITGLGQTRCLAWQEVTITPGHSYVFSGVFKNSSFDAVTNTWVEVVLSRKVPDPAADYTVGGGDFIYQRTTWMAAPWADMSVVDGKLITESVFAWKGASSTGGDSTLTSETITIPDTVSVTSWYVGLKAGIWNDVAGVPTFIYLFDNISLWDLAEPISSGIHNIATPGNTLSTVYPTLSNGFVTIKSNGTKDLSYSIYNNLGSMVKSGVLTDDKLKLDLSSMAGGVYFVNVTSQSKSETHKLILR